MQSSDLGRIFPLTEKKPSWIEFGEFYTIIPIRVREAGNLFFHVYLIFINVCNF
jgi:hypothetical protein